MLGIELAQILQALHPLLVVFNLLVELCQAQKRFFLQVSNLHRAAVLHVPNSLLNISNLAEAPGSFQKDAPARV